MSITSQDLDKRLIKQRLNPPFLHLPLLFVLLFGIFLLLMLADKTLSTDPTRFLENATSLYLTGETGLQFRNILFGYFLAVPLYLEIDPILFGLCLSGISLLLSALLLYRINLDHSLSVVATFVSLLFIISYSNLRYGSRTYTDIPNALFLLAMIFFHFKFLKENKPWYLLLAYFMAASAVSLRYASGLIFPAYLYYMWITRKFYKWHLLGFVVAVIPYIPQLIYNINYLGGPIALSYADAREFPVFSWRHFIYEPQNGHNYQIITYLRFIFLDFRGLFILFTPISIFGAVRSFKRIDPRKATYLLLFFVSYVFLLSFYFSFFGRYIIPALIPVFIWLSIGITDLYSLLDHRKTLRVLYSIALIVGAYMVFEISFQLIQSAKALHETHNNVFAKADEFVEAGDVIFTHPRIKPIFLQDKGVKFVQEIPEVSEIKEKYHDGQRRLYVIVTEKKFTSDGVDRDLSTDKIQEYMDKVYTVKSEDITELIMYRVLRLLGKERLIPSEEWGIYRLSLE